MPRTPALLKDRVGPVTDFVTAVELDLPRGEDDHRRVRAVLTFLAGSRRPRVVPD
jgi:hypothetical protein